MRPSAILLLLVGLWLLLQTIGGDLPGRIASWATRSTAGSDDASVEGVSI